MFQRQFQQSLVLAPHIDYFEPKIKKLLGVEYLHSQYLHVVDTANSPATLQY